MKPPKITIITPSYNQGRFLEQTIQSVVDQWYPNLEYLIFDGGSTDNSVQIIKKYAKKYPFIQWQSKKDNGQVHAINQGLKKATGDIITYINSDDYYLPNSFTKVAIFFQENPQKHWLVGDCQVTKKKLNWTFFLKKINPFHLSRFALEIYNPINQPAVFLTRKLIQKVGLFDYQYRYAFDYDYWLRCSLVSLPGRIRKPLATFRAHKQSKGNTNYEKQLEEDYQITKKLSQNPLSHLIHFLANNLTLFFYRFLK